MDSIDNLRRMMPVTCHIADGQIFNINTDGFLSLKQDTEREFKVILSLTNNSEISIIKFLFVLTIFFRSKNKLFQT